MKNDKSGVSRFIFVLNFMSDSELCTVAYTDAWAATQPISFLNMEDYKE